MKTPATLDRALELNATVAACLLVKPAGSAMGETVHRGLLAAGMRVLSVPTVYDAVVEADRMMRPSSAGPVGLRHFIVGIDFFGQQELRLFPLVRREWPQTLLVAYHSPGFDYKGRLAELLGADVILGSDEDVVRFAESLVMPAAPPAAAASKPEPASAAPAQEEPAPPQTYGGPRLRSRSHRWRLLRSQPRPRRWQPRLPHRRPRRWRL